MGRRPSLGTADRLAIVCFSRAHCFQSAPPYTLWGSPDALRIISRWSRTDLYRLPNLYVREGIDMGRLPGQPGPLETPVEAPPPPPPNTTTWEMISRHCQPPLFGAAAASQKEGRRKSANRHSPRLNSARHQMTLTEQAGSTMGRTLFHLSRRARGEGCAGIWRKRFHRDHVSPGPGHTLESGCMKGEGRDDHLHFQARCA